MKQVQATRELGHTMCGYTLLVFKNQRVIDEGTRGHWGYVPPRFCNKQRSALFIVRKCPLFLKEESALKVSCPPSLRCFLRPCKEKSSYCKSKELDILGKFGSRYTQSPQVITGTTSIIIRLVFKCSTHPSTLVSLFDFSCFKRRQYRT